LNPQITIYIILSPDVFYRSANTALKFKDVFKHGYKYCLSYYHTVYYSDNDDCCFITKKR